MNNQNQPTMKSPKPFCLFRKVIGLFFIVFGFALLSAGTIEEGEREAEENSLHKSDSVIVHVSEGTFIHNFPNASTPKKQTIAKKTHRVQKKIHKIENLEQTVPSENKIANKVIPTTYLPVPRDPVYFTSVTLKTAFTTSNKNHHSKNLSVQIKEQQSKDFYVSETKILFREKDVEHIYFSDHHSIRPPPIFI